MKRHVIGIDPGITGGIALLSSGKFVGVWAMPTQAKKTSGNEVDARALIDLGLKIRTVHFADPENNHLDLVAVERTSAAPVFGKGAKRMGSGLATGFSMGDSFGCARMFAATFDARVHVVAPVSWKGALKLGRNKGHAIALAHRLYPASREHITLKKHDGLAEALLIAHYANLHL